MRSYQDMEGLFRPAGSEQTHQQHRGDPAVGRLIFTLDSYIELYQNHKELLCYNDNFNHYVSHVSCEEAQLEKFHKALYSVDTRLHMMYEKAKQDGSFRTDIPEEEFCAPRCMP